MMIPDKCPKCKRLNYWNRETDFTDDDGGVIKIRWLCDAPDCDYATDWFVYVYSAIQK